MPSPLENAQQNRKNADKAFRDAMDDAHDKFVAAKAAYVADPTPQNYDAKKEAGQELSAARAIDRADRPGVGGSTQGTFNSADAIAFLPDDQGGNTARALELLVNLFDQRNDTTSDPQTVLDDMRANITATRSI